MGGSGGDSASARLRASAAGDGALRPVSPLGGDAVDGAGAEEIALAFATASAATVTADATQNTVSLDLTDDVTQESITMNAVVQLPDGSRSRKTKTFRTMEEAVEGYIKFVTTLPYGSRLIRVQFTDESGQVVFASQG